MGDLEKALPTEITKQAVLSGNELLFPLDEGRAAVRIASRNLITVLGLEVFRILDLSTETLSGLNLSSTETGKTTSVLTTMQHFGS
jgi:hypothetical protein